MERFIRILKVYGESVVVYTKGEYEDTTAGEMRDEDIRNVMKRLCEYEDTGLTPPEIMELKERDTEEEISETQSYGVFFYECPICNEYVHEKDNFCSKCGQRLKKRED